MKKCLFRAILALLAMAPCLTGPVRAAGEPVTLFVFDRQPYYHLDSGRPDGGFLLTLAQIVFRRAGVPYRIREMPPGRILATFETEDVNSCAVGWLQTPARQRFARFSAPIYVNKPLGVAVRAPLAAKDGPQPLGDLLKKHWKWGLRLGFSYGQALDAAFAAAPAGTVTRFSDPTIMLRLLAKGRLDAILIEPEELSWLLEREPRLAAAMRFVPLAGAKPRARHIMCDDAVSPDVMRRLDAAIDEILGPASDTIRRTEAMRH
ncbi:extracellular solute-binding protein family 3 [Solidesulfovibrio fructosivorans JJ]]|uniref:Extracellular solute-binding protein family 3 n=1 Tax=Solidesulfovibrio fructosivorans JJ] TaxID=596151 RepID=E1K0W3_SOLFR|nr:transporter substrate-binding domain-containing protein [Solidesulfovibrio fructosivorans]EFL49728.1 extracellular solute-binding protein family 3 [Solidesulfovibrio fructosivorans JJ]]